MRETLVEDPNTNPERMTSSPMKIIDYNPCILPLLVMKTVKPSPQESTWQSDRLWSMT
jgi:hypothetical protein